MSDIVDKGENVEKGRGGVKRQGAVKRGNGESDEKGEQKPHIQFLCTAPLYSTKHTVV